MLQWEYNGKQKCRKSRPPGVRPAACWFICFSETTTRGCAGESKRVFAVSSERSEMVFNIKKMYHTMKKATYRGAGGR